MPLDPEDRAELLDIVREAMAGAAANPPDSPAELDADAATVVEVIEDELADDAGAGEAPDELAVESIGGPPDDDGLTATVDDAGLGVIDDVPDVAGVVPIIEDTAPVREHPYWRKLKIRGGKAS